MTARARDRHGGLDRARVRSPRRMARLPAVAQPKEAAQGPNLSTKAPLVAALRWTSTDWWHPDHLAELICRVGHGEWLGRNGEAEPFTNGLPSVSGGPLQQAT
jgi:hypothetical protein